MVVSSTKNPKYPKANLWLVEYELHDVKLSMKDIN